MSTITLLSADQSEIFLSFRYSPMNALTSVELREINPDYERIIDELITNGHQIVSLQVGNLRIYKLKGKGRQ